MLFKNNEKLPYLHKITKRRFLVSNKNMGLCLNKYKNAPFFYNKAQINQIDPKLVSSHSDSHLMSPTL